MAEATTPMAEASRRSDSSTWRLLAPTALSSAFCRVRWATVMKKVLKIMNPPTSRATIAKISRASTSTTAHPTPAITGPLEEDCRGR